MMILRSFCSFVVRYASKIYTMSVSTQRTEKTDTDKNNQIVLLLDWEGFICVVLGGRFMTNAPLIESIGIDDK